MLPKNRFISGSQGSMMMLMMSFLFQRGEKEGLSLRTPIVPCEKREPPPVDEGWVEAAVLTVLAMK